MAKARLHPGDWAAELGSLKHLSCDADGLPAAKWSLGAGIRKQGMLVKGYGSSMLYRSSAASNAQVD